jgi:hypothetical protein
MTMTGRDHVSEEIIDEEGDLSADAALSDLQIPEADDAAEDGSDTSPLVETPKRKKVAQRHNPQEKFGMRHFAFHPVAALQRPGADTYRISINGKERQISNGAGETESKVISVIFRLVAERQNGSSTFGVYLDLVHKKLANADTFKKTFSERIDHSVVRSVTLYAGLDEAAARKKLDRLAACLDRNEGVIKLLGLVGVARAEAVEKYPEFAPKPSALFEQEAAGTPKSSDTPQEKPDIADTMRRVTTLSEEEIRRIQAQIHPSLRRG